VRGAAGLDREWSTSALSGELVGWDWFALQLDDGWDLMAYRLRREDGSADPFSAASLVDPSGGSVSLRVGADVTVEATSTWRSPLDGSAYPSGWTVRIPSRGWDLLVEPRVADQELDGAFRYWEGSVSVRGIGEGGRTVAGVGYAELTGYAEATRDR
jgi:predicted secreted hydrolase